MNKLEESLNKMNTLELTNRFNMLQRRETHYRVLKQQTKEILIKKQYELIIKEGMERMNNK